MNARSVEESELVARFKAIKFALDTGFRNLVLKGDNLPVMNALRNIEDGLGLDRVIVVDIVQKGQNCSKLLFFCSA